MPISISVYQYNFILNVIIMMVSLYHIQQHSTISSLPFCQLFPLAKKEKNPEHYKK